MIFKENTQLKTDAGAQDVCTSQDSLNMNCRNTLMFDDPCGLGASGVHVFIYLFIYLFRYLKCLFEFKLKGRVGRRKAVGNLFLTQPLHLAGDKMLHLMPAFF